MKHIHSLLSIPGLWRVLPVFVAAAALTARGDIVVPGADGSDGAFNPTNALTIIDLTAAPTGVWNGPNASPTNGVYDSEKWAVVFRYSSVNIPAGVTVRFLNNPATAPVVWLVSGDVTINGTIDLNGENQQMRQSVPGPGGFRGSMNANLNWSSGFGIGGGSILGGPGGVASGGSYATRVSSRSGPAFGSSTLVPLSGGSGGGGGYQSGGGAGGGAIVIASAKIMRLNGSIIANGGSATAWGGGGSGGAVRLIADTLTGIGGVVAVGGAYSYPETSGGFGRVRIETRVPYSGVNVTPAASYASITNTIQLWPEDTAPRVAIQSIGAVPAPVFPNGGQQAEMEVGTGNGTNTVTVEAFNLPATAQVKVRATPFIGPHQEFLCTRISGDDAHSFWQASVPLSAGPMSLQVRATTQ